MSPPACLPFSLGLCSSVQQRGTLLSLEPGLVPRLLLANRYGRSPGARVPPLPLPEAGHQPQVNHPSRLLGDDRHIPVTQITSPASDNQPLPTNTCEGLVRLMVAPV